MADTPDGALPVVGFIGLGNMGHPMSRHLVEAGYRVCGFDLSETARSAFAAHGDGAVPVTSAAAAAAGADVVILMLPDSDAVESVAADPAFLAALTADTVVVDMSSSEPERTRSLAKTLGERGVTFLDAPVSGGVKGAVAAKLAVMAGGAGEDVRRVEGVLGNFGTVFRAGPVGAGHAVKALNNLMSAAHLLASSEAILAGERFGVDPAAMLAIVNASSGRSASTENKWPNYIVPGTYDAGFSLKLMVKDVRIAVDLARQLGMPGRLGERTAELWAEAERELPATADHTAIARWLRDRAAAAPVLAEDLAKRAGR